MKSVWVLEHTACESLGTMEDTLRNAGVDFTYVATHSGDTVPREMAGRSGLIVMGGPMGVFENARYPFLRDEMRLIESALKSGKPVLGVCLGSQLLAAVLGANVTKGEKKELGWHPVTLTGDAAADGLLAGVPAEFWPFHWHGDVFPLPAKAVRLASSRQTPNQAFRFGPNAYGILFHLEVTANQISQMLLDFADELQEAGGNANDIAAQSPQYLPALQETARTVFGRWARLLCETP